MNRLHRWLCASRVWTTRIEGQLPWALEGVALGSDVLEVGPGPGAATTHLTRGRRLTCLEIDETLAAGLAARLDDVRVVCGDATALSFRPASFDAVVSFTMLHHVGSAVLQDRLFGEVVRVLRPGGVFAGTDTTGGAAVRLFHIGDTYVPLAAGTLPARLARVGFADVDVAVRGDALRFRARRPS